MRDRFVQDGHRFYFPDGAEAFKDRGRKLTTTSENDKVVESLVEIARSRGWSEITLSGTERFRQEAWRQARTAGLDVRGYKPSEEDRTRLIRALGRNLQSHSIRDENPADKPATPVRSAGATVPEPPTPAATRPRARREQVAGKLLGHGKDAYQHDPGRDPSYFVRLQTRDGVREVWGKDIERAVAKSLTKPQIGDEVILERSGREAVTVRRKERDQNGETHEKPIDVYRNRWVIEKREFFEERAASAALVRNESVGAKEAVQARRELASTYLKLRLAELVARDLQDRGDRRLFVAHVRGALADSIERGESLAPVRIRERTRRPSRPELASVRGREDPAAAR